MIIHFKFIILLALAFLALSGTVVSAETAVRSDSVVEEKTSGSQNQQNDEEENHEIYPSEVPLADAKIETHHVYNAQAGYRFFNIDSYGGRAAPYEYLHSNPVVGAVINSLGKDHKFALEGMFLNDNDYHGDLLYDYMGNYRFHLRTESLFHNLDHERLFSPNFRFSSGTSYNSNDLNPDDRFGLKVEQNLAAFRYKVGDSPIHLSLGYWQLNKEGDRQLIFADQAFNPTGASNSIFSEKRRISLETHEGNIGFDAHLGPLDVIYSFTIRQLHNRGETPRSFFNSRLDSKLEDTQTNSGFQEHNSIPESRFTSHTIKLHTDPTGGIVGAASYTYVKRENLSTLSDIKGTDQSSDTLHNAAGDFVYIPCKEFSLALKFRHQEIDRENAGSLTSAFLLTPTISVRPSIATEKNSLTATVSIKPTNLLTIKGEYKGEFLQRDHLDQWNRPGVAASISIPEDSEIHRGTLTILSRPIKGLRLKAKYGYAATNNPSYGNSFEEKNEGQLLASYTYLNKWGVVGNYQNMRESNDQIAISTLATSSPSVYLQLPRDKKAVNSTASIWFSLFDKLTITGSYGLLRSSISQTVLFSGPSASSNVASNYTSQAQLYSLSAVYHLGEKLDFSLGLQQIRSFAEFDPLYVAVSATTDTSNIKEISRIKTVENSVSVRADYSITKNVSCAIDYSYREYDDKYSSFFNGSVNTILTSLVAKW